MNFMANFLCIPHLDILRKTIQQLNGHELLLQVVNTQQQYCAKHQKTVAPPPNLMSELEAFLFVLSADLIEQHYLFVRQRFDMLLQKFIPFCLEGLHYSLQSGRSQLLFKSLEAESSHQHIEEAELGLVVFLCSDQLRQFIDIRIADELFDRLFKLQGMLAARGLLPTCFDYKIPDFVGLKYARRCCCPCLVLKLLHALQHLRKQHRDTLSFVLIQDTLNRIAQALSQLSQPRDLLCELFHVEQVPDKLGCLADIDLAFFEVVGDFGHDLGILGAALCLLHEILQASQPNTLRKELKLLQSITIQSTVMSEEDSCYSNDEEYFLDLCRGNELDEIKQFIEGLPEQSQFNWGWFNLSGSNFMHMLAANNYPIIYDYLLPVLQKRCTPDQILEIVNRQNSSRSTPLHFAVINDSKDIIVRLLAAGADPQLRNEHDRTPLAQAEKFKKFQAAELLAPVTKTDIEALKKQVENVKLNDDDSDEEEEGTANLPVVEEGKEEYDIIETGSKQEQQQESTAQNGEKKQQKSQ